jgi:hypothetical protein
VEVTTGGGAEAGAPQAAIRSRASVRARSDMGLLS